MSKLNSVTAQIHDSLPSSQQPRSRNKFKTSQTLPCKSDWLKLRLVPCLTYQKRNRPLLSAQSCTNAQTQHTSDSLPLASDTTSAVWVQVRTASCGATACVNSFGDEQLAVDLLADKLLFEALRFSHVCKWACSEEVPEPVDMEGATHLCAYNMWSYMLVQWPFLNIMVVNLTTVDTFSKVSLRFCNLACNV